MFTTKDYEKLAGVLNTEYRDVQYRQRIHDRLASYNRSGDAKTMRAVNESKHGIECRREVFYAITRRLVNVLEADNERFDGLQFMQAVTKED